MKKMNSIPSKCLVFAKKCQILSFVEFDGIQKFLLRKRMNQMKDWNLVNEIQHSNSIRFLQNLRTKRHLSSAQFNTWNENLAFEENALSTLYKTKQFILFSFSLITA